MFPLRAPQAGAGYPASRGPQQVVPQLPPVAHQCTLNAAVLPASSPAVAGEYTEHTCLQPEGVAAKAGYCCEATSCVCAKPASHGRLQSMTVTRTPKPGVPRRTGTPQMLALLPFPRPAGSRRLSLSSSLRVGCIFAWGSASSPGLIWLRPHCPSHTCFA